jgi:hypothetical protein
MPKKIAKVDLDKDTTQLITDWVQASSQLAEVKSKENQLRVKLVEMNFTATKLEGTESIDIGWDYRLKATKSMNYSATNQSGQMEALLSAVAAIDPGIAQSLVKWKPELSVTAYREVLKLAEQHPALNALIAAATTVKPGMPVLELIPPKEKTPPPPTVEAGATVIEDGVSFKEGF